MRVHGLDALRGLCAIGVVVFHYCMWSLGPKLFTVGLYGVYVFFVLSGASLYLAYHSMNSQEDIKRFMVNRALRIGPLLAAASIYMGLTAHASIGEIWLNATLMFGLGSSNIVVGAWSLGIEFVFYLFFPVLLVFSRSRAWPLVALVLLISQRFFIEDVLSTSIDTAWLLYIKPLAFIFYFFAGCVIGRAFHERWFNPSIWWVVACVAALAFMIWLPVPSMTGALVGWAGLVLTLAACLVTLSAGYVPKMPGFQFLGDISYGTYLLHPIIWYSDFGYLVFYWTDSELARAAVCLPVTILLAWMSNKYFEMPLRRWGGRRLMQKAMSAA